MKNSRSENFLTKNTRHRNSTPSVTVCIPAYNAGKTLRRTLNSILEQEYPNFKVIVCDNNSTDNTAEIVKEFSKYGVYYFLNPTHTGWGESNWNFAISLATGPFIALYHADDLYESTMLRQQVNFLLKHSQVSSVFTMTQMIDEWDRPIKMGKTQLPKELKGKSIFAFPELFNAVLKYGNFMIVPTLMTRRKTLDMVGNFSYKKFYSASDIDLWLRMAYWQPIGIIDKPLHKYRISEQQGSVKINRCRNHLAHFYKVIDCYLYSKEISHHVNNNSLEIYKMHRSADQIFVAINLFLQDKTKNADKLLSKAISWRNVRKSFFKPIKIIWFIFGIQLLIANRLRIGKAFAKFGYWAHDSFYKNKRKLKRA